MKEDVGISKTKKYRNKIVMVPSKLNTISTCNSTSESMIVLSDVVDMVQVKAKHKEAIFI